MAPRIIEVMIMVVILLALYLTARIYEDTDDRLKFIENRVKALDDKVFPVRETTFKQKVREEEKRMEVITFKDPTYFDGEGYQITEERFVDENQGIFNKVAKNRNTRSENIKKGERLDGYPTGAEVKRAIKVFKKRVK